LQGGEQQGQCNRRREPVIEEDGELALHALQQMLD
jgi:hypothetical protein